MKRHNYKNLKVWQKARYLNKDIYTFSKLLPEDERFGISSQLRRASISIMANIAEGSGRSTVKDFSYFIAIAYASSLETENLLIVCLDLSYIDENTFNSITEQLNEIQRMLNGLRKSLTEE